MTPDPGSNSSETESLAAEKTKSYAEDSPSSSLSEPLARGRSVGRYIILDRVGEGGMGVVYAAYDPSLDRRVALKFLAPHQTSRDGVRERRLVREAQAMARLSHPHVAVVYEVDTFQGRVYLAMEFVDGVDLRTWLEEKRSADEVLEVFGAAGRGLAAAHAAQIVHRDFKPENVLIDRQGRPRVTDFGLSRTVLELDEEPQSSRQFAANGLSTPSQLSSPLTRTGGLLGTPSYMPPEQWLGREVDARGDQFSFCVALYEALCRDHPFGPTAERTENAIAGRIVESPAQTSIPKHCRQPLMRGLDAEPAKRYPSMDALLAALSPERGRRRRRLAVAAALAVVTLGGAAFLLSTDRPAAAPGPRCDRGAQHLAGIWNPARKDRLRDVFQSSGARDAGVTWRSFSSILDRRASAWAAMHDEACAATHVEGVQSPGVLDLRMECLARRRQEMKTLVDLYFEKPDAGMLDRAAVAAEKLTSVSSCADVANLRAVVPLPVDPATRAKVESLRVRLARSSALYEAGRHEQGIEYTGPVAQEAERVGYAPVAAEASLALARHLIYLGRAEEADKVLDAGAKQAVAARDLKLEAEIWLALLTPHPRHQQGPEQKMLARVAALAVERAGGDDLLRARLASHIGAGETRLGNFPEAVHQLERAADLYRRSVDDSSMELAATLPPLATALAEVGRTREAMKYAEQALHLQSSVLRPGHPDIHKSSRVMARLDLDLGRFRHLMDTLVRVVEVQVAELGPDHPATTYPLELIASAEAELGHTDRAVEIFTKVLSMRKKARDPSGVYVAVTYLGLGDVQRIAGLLRDAEANLNKSLQILARAGMGDAIFSQEGWVRLGLVRNGLGRHRQALSDCRRAPEPKSGQINAESLAIGTCLGEALIGLGDYSSARRELERVVTPETEHNFGPHLTGSARFQLARALWATPADRPRAREMARRTLDSLVAAEGDQRALIARIEAWLQTHR